MKVCLLICLAVVGSRGQLAAQKILTPAREDDPRDKTQLSFMHDSSSSSEEKPQEGLDHCIICIYKLGCHPPICHKWGCCSKEGAENSTRVEPSDTKEPQEGAENSTNVKPSDTKEPQEGLDHCKRCIYQLGCHPPICHKWGCCRKEGAENSTSVEPSNTKENGADEVMKLYVKINAKPEGENGEERGENGIA